MLNCDYLSKCNVWVWHVSHTSFHVLKCEVYVGLPMQN